MKKLNVLFVFLFTMAPLHLFSQVTLTSANNPVIGDLQYDVRVDTTGLLPGNSGANQTWNFTNLVRVDSSVHFWISPVGTPYAAQFPNSNICAHDTCYNYFKTFSAGFEYHGYNSQTTVVPYTNVETIMAYPFGYNSSFSDNFSAVIPNQSGNVYRSGNVNSTADAWGTINLPFGSYSNVLRVKHIINIRDSLSGIPAIITTFTIYEWYAAGKKFNIFNIVYTTISFSDMDFNFKNSHYNPNSTPIGIRPIGLTLPDNYNLSQNYPNPFNPATNIRFQVPAASNVSIVIYDNLGRELETLVNEKLGGGTYEVDWDAGKYASGTYFYRLTSGDFTETRKMILVK